MGIFTAWKDKDSRTRLQKWATRILQAGPIPKHVAVIMDGNRRYSRKKKISLTEGYKEGGEKLCQAIRWCKEMGIKEATVYAFSIENFNRSQEEQKILFRLLQNELEEILEEGAIENEEYGLQIRFIGDSSMYPEDLKSLMAELMLRTRHQTEGILNIAFAYTSRNELARGAEVVRQGVEDGNLKTEDVDEYLLNASLQIHPTSPVDLLIRTSQTYRLSDFMLWQSTEGVLHFLDCEWPELSFWDLCSGVFKFQRKYGEIQKQRTCGNSQDNKDSAKIKRQESWIQKIRENDWETLSKAASL